jgi:hypothetical protein
MNGAKSSNNQSTCYNGNLFFGNRPDSIFTCFVPSGFCTPKLLSSCERIQTVTVRYCIQLLVRIRCPRSVMRWTNAKRLLAESQLAADCCRCCCCYLAIAGCIISSRCWGCMRPRGMSAQTAAAGRNESCFNFHGSNAHCWHQKWMGWTGFSFVMCFLHRNR